MCVDYDFCGVCVVGCVDGCDFVGCGVCYVCVVVVCVLCGLVCGVCLFGCV